MPMFPFWPAQEPASIPEPGMEVRGSTDRAATAGQLRSTDVGDTPLVDHPVPEVVAGSAYWWQPLIGTPRTAMMPSAMTTLHPVDPEFGGDLGTHGELVQSTSTPNGEQLAFGSSPKTWRAAPNPWDADLYAGWTGNAQPGGS